LVKSIKQTFRTPQTEPVLPCSSSWPISPRCLRFLPYPSEGQIAGQRIQRTNSRITPLNQVGTRSTASPQSQEEWGAVERVPTILAPTEPPTHAERLRSISIRNTENGICISIRNTENGILDPLTTLAVPWYNPGPTLVP
jgi:hypothetical protein